MMAGANLAAVQRILRHSDPKLTMEVYGHLAPGYLRAEADRLAFAPAPRSEAARHSKGMERDIGLEPTTFSLGRTRLPSQALAAGINHAEILVSCQR